MGEGSMKKMKCDFGEGDKIAILAVTFCMVPNSFGPFHETLLQ